MLLWKVLRVLARAGMPHHKVPLNPKPLNPVAHACVAARAHPHFAAQHQVSSVSAQEPSSYRLAFSLAAGSSKMASGVQFDKDAP